MPLTTNMNTLGVKDHTHEYTVDASTGSTGTPGTISPDDTASEGVATSLARSDHRHAITAAAAAALTLTGTAGEGAASSFARSDHVHSTSALPWGIVARQILTANNNNAAVAGSGEVNSDFVLTPTVAADRLYLVHCHTVVDYLNIAATTAGLTIKFTVDAVETGWFYRQSEFTAPPDAVTCDGSILWTPSAGTPTIRVRIRNDSGTARDINLLGSAANPRAFWVEDIGPR